MEEREKNIGDAFMEVARNKMEKQDKKIADMETAFQGLSQITKQLDHLTPLVEKLNDPGNNLQTIHAKSAELLAALKNTKTTILETKAQPVQHHHHFPKILWALVALLIVLTIVASDLYITYKKLDSYKAGDIKYRFLKLDTSAYSLQRRLYTIDSIYNIQPDFRTKVIKMEEEKQYKLEELSKASLLRKEADEHEKNARQNKPAK
ncbi:hypothetical protein QEG73_12800 [Chitinophagaceae bacterium 26-R-25]|nr:hypothetical protein [Chitinophagaceae bacterium 26-R-25]